MSRQEQKIPSAQDFEPLFIKGVVVDQCSLPSTDGAPYKVVLELSARPIRLWRDSFVQAWTKPASFGFMHRPSIASVWGDKIILDGTTIEEVEQHHKQTLDRAVEKANAVCEQTFKQILEQEIAQQKKNEKKHRAHLSEVAARIKFR